MSPFRLLLAGVLTLVLAASQPASAEPVDAEAADLAAKLLVPSPQARQLVLAAIVKRGKTDMVAPLIQALRFVDGDQAILFALEELTGENAGDSWDDWMLWQQAHPEIEPFAGFDAFKADVMAQVRREFRALSSARRAP